MWLPPTSLCSWAVATRALASLLRIFQRPIVSGPRVQRERSYLSLYKSCFMSSGTGSFSVAEETGFGMY